ncbi:MAG: hypothetical protein ACJAT7_001279 [Psychromonas sp.]|jgi:hypothetical protein
MLSKCHIFHMRFHFVILEVLLALRFPIGQLGNDGGEILLVILNDPTPSSSKCSTPSSSRWFVEELIEFMVLLGLGTEGEE